jgi:hypothetical protein
MNADDLNYTSRHTHIYSLSHYSMCLTRDIEIKRQKKKKKILIILFYLIFLNQIFEQKILQSHEILHTVC